MSQSGILNRGVYPPFTVTEKLSPSAGTIPVTPDGANNINLVSGNNITTTGTGAHTIQFSLTGTTDHCLQVGNAAGSLTSLAAATNGQIAIGSTGADPVIAAIGAGNNIGITNGAGSISVAVTGTTDHCMQVGNAAGSLTSLAAATNGQIPIGSTGADPVIATLTAGANITITNAPGSITIASSTSSFFNYTGVDFAASPYNALITDLFISCDLTGGSITIRLPNAPAVGEYWIIKDRLGLANTNNITVTTVGGAVNIDGATSYVINLAFGSAQFIFNGTSYEVF